MSLKADHIKIETALVALLQQVIIAGKTQCFFDINDLGASLKLSHLPKSKWHDVISATLTGKAFYQKFGDWITCEYEGSVRVLVQLAKAGELQSVCDEEKNHFAIYGAKTIRRSFPIKKQKLIVEIPASLDPDEARKFIEGAMITMANTGNVADMHDEDIRNGRA